MHDAYKCGEYWNNISGSEQRGNCTHCDSVDSIEHALIECRATGQGVIWRLAEELWLLRGAAEWIRPTMGSILSSALADVRKTGGKRKLTGASRLYTILVTESAQLIWQRRCQWRVSDESDPLKILPDDAIRVLWVKTINKRLRLECLLTDQRKYGKKALKKSTVENTWWPVLKGRRALQDDWTTDTGV
ncbi:hypothetical protein CPC08DRAFT_243025 [Agrocybe pediades]|nr:hypothetical protein CPC08DRAFT_243025 [Agrocybe pediades]